MEHGFEFILKVETRKERGHLQPEGKGKKGYPRRFPPREETASPATTKTTYATANVSIEMM